MTIGERVYDALFNASTPTVVGANDSVTVQKQMKGNSTVTEAAIKETMINYWNTVGPAILGPDLSVEYRELRVYDGSPKRKTPSENHLDHFIPEENFHGSPDPDYTEYERNKNDETIVPEFNAVPELASTRNGYRVVITDDKVQADSIIHPVIYYLDKNEENDLPDTYDHVSPGSIAIVNQKSEEFQIFFEQKGAYYIKYSIWNHDRNVDSKPQALPFEG